MYVYKNDPCLKIFDESAIQDRYLKARDIAFEYIKELCFSDSIPMLYNVKFCSNLMMSISKDFTTSKVTIYKNLRLYPYIKIHHCIIHQLRVSIEYAPYKERKAFVADFKAVYDAVTEDTALENLFQQLNSGEVNIKMQLRVGKIIGILL